MTLRLPDGFIPPFELDPYDGLTGPADLGELWTLTKGGETLAARVSTHRQGWTVHLSRNGAWVRTDLAATRDRVWALSEGWRRNCRERGWT